MRTTVVAVAVALALVASFAQAGPKERKCTKEERVTARVHPDADCIVTTATIVVAVRVTPKKSPTKGPYDGFYWEKKHELGLLITGPIFAQSMDWPFFSTGTWIGGYHNDKILLGNFALDAVLVDNYLSTEPNVAIGFTVSPIGVCVPFGYSCEKLKHGAGEPLFILKPTYTYLIGLNGDMRPRSAFGFRFSFVLPHR